MVLKGIYVESMGCLNEDAQKKKEIKEKAGESLLYISLGRDDQVAGCTKLLDVNYKLHGFSGDLSGTSK